MSWKVKAILTTIDKFDKMHFCYMVDDDLHNKFVKYIHGEHVPFSDTEFWITPQSVTNDMRKFVGSPVSLEILPTSYKFKSKLPGNLGENVSGIKFKLINISFI